MIIQIIGLPGSGKTTLARALKERTNAIHLNADEVRADINSDLGFSEAEREEQSRRLGAMARLLSNQGHDVIVDFVCPTIDTRTVFGRPDILIWMNTIKQGRFLDTNKLWQDPENVDYTFNEQTSIDDMVSTIIEEFALFDWSAPTTLMLGRYQPWHEGHQMLRDHAAERTDQVLIGVRNTYNTSDKDPLPYNMVEKLIVDKNSGYVNLIKRLPNITNIVYGRDVGYKIEQIDLPADIQAISATQRRKEMGI
jgi:adenylylsulfate kinase